MATAAWGGLSAVWGGAGPAAATPTGGNGTVEAGVGVAVLGVGPALAALKETGAPGKTPVVPMLSLDDVRSEHAQLGLHVSMEVKEKIWKGAYVDIFDLLQNSAKGDDCRGGKNCSHARDCGHWSYQRRVEENIGN